MMRPGAGYSWFVLGIRVLVSVASSGATSYCSGYPLVSVSVMGVVTVSGSRVTLERMVGTVDKDCSETATDETVG